MPISKRGNIGYSSSSHRERFKWHRCRLSGLNCSVEKNSKSSNIGSDSQGAHSHPIKYEMKREILDGENMIALRELICEALDYMKEIKSNVSAKDDEAELENEWRRIAYVMDKIFFRLYFAFLVVSHVAILSVAVITSNKIEPHPEHLKGADSLQR